MGAYTGKLLNAENTMNLHISDVISKSKTGQSTHLETTYLRGSHIKLIVLPEILRHGPFFTKVKTNLKRKLEEREKNDDENRKNKKQKKNNCCYDQYSTLLSFAIRICICMYTV